MDSNVSKSADEPSSSAVFLYHERNRPIRARQIHSATHRKKPTVLYCEDLFI